MQTLIVVSVLFAQDRPESRQPVARAFFARPSVDFWGTGKKKTSPRVSTESLFAEPIRLPDGRFTVYVPPPEVLAFLESPSKENARGYLSWQKSRAAKIAAALEALEAVKLEETSPAPVRITYFRQSG